LSKLKQSAAEISYDIELG